MENYELHEIPVIVKNFPWHPEWYAIQGKFQSTDIEWCSGIESWVSILCLNSLWKRDYLP